MNSSSSLPITSTLRGTDESILLFNRGIPEGFIGFYSSGRGKDLAHDAIRFYDEALLNSQLTHAPSISVTIGGVNEPTRESAGPFGNAESGDDCAIFVPSHKKSSLKGKSDTQGNDNSGHRLNKFVRHLHDMLVAEKDSQAVEWRCGLLILQNTASFAATILPKYFDTRNFKTFRRQLNYYGFVHVRSYSKAASSTIAIWVNRSLIETVKNPKEICSVLSIKRVETCETSKTSEGRQLRKQMAISAADEYINTCLIVAPKQCDGYKIDKAIQESKLDGIIGKKLDVVLDPIQNLKTSPIVVSSVSVTSGDSFPNSYVRSPGSIQRTVSNEEDESSPKTPRSSTSAANLLLLLSKAG